MEHDEIIDRGEVLKMARQAGIESNQYMIYEALAHTVFVCSIQELETFAKLVAEAAASKEREACAFICDELHWPWHMGDNSGPKECAEAIRARGEAQ